MDQETSVTATTPGTLIARTEELTISLGPTFDIPGKETPSALGLVFGIKKKGIVTQQAEGLARSLLTMTPRTGIRTAVVRLHYAVAQPTYRQVLSEPWLAKLCKETPLPFRLKLLPKYAWLTMCYYAEDFLDLLDPEDHLCGGSSPSHSLLLKMARTYGDGRLWVSAETINFSHHVPLGRRFIFELLPK